MKRLAIIFLSMIAFGIAGCKPSNDAGKTGVGAMKGGDATDQAMGSSSAAPVAAPAASAASSTGQ